MECYLMTRNGVFVPKKHTGSQCATMGHVAYNYTLKLVFPSPIKLDKQNLIIDHVEINDLVVATAASGTCEQMHPLLCGAIKSFFAKKKIPLHGYRMSIQPGPVEGAAYMEYFFVAEGVHEATVLSMLN